ncbi:MAG: hypothetical protein QOJ40_1402 [Verrucomicrobiota bacterium]
MIKTVSMLKFRQNAKGILRRVAKGERFVLSHRGHPAARLEPIAPPASPDLVSDAFLTIARRASRSAKGKTRHQDIDSVLYGQR